MSEQALAPKQGESSQESEQEQPLIRFIAIGYTKEGKIEMVTLDSDDARIDGRDLLLFKRFLDDSITRMFDPFVNQTAGALQQIYDVSMRLVAKVDMLESQINNLKK